MLDKLIVEVDRAVKTLCLKPNSIRFHPDQNIVDGEFNSDEKKHIIGLMRVNHTGEICAQGLYQGQRLTARDQTHRQELEEASNQEEEHLAWTLQRIKELGGKASLLNPLFYIASLTLGVSAGALGDKWNLGFLKETEIQVGTHLSSHLNKIPLHDNKSRAILEQMALDEAAHAKMAEDYGAAELPILIKKLMTLSSKLMTNTTYYI